MNIPLLRAKSFLYTPEHFCTSLQSAFCKLSKLNVFSLSLWLRVTYKNDHSWLLSPRPSPIKPHLFESLVWRNE